MITNYNYVTNRDQKWYSEEEYNKLKKEFKNEGNDTDNNSGSNTCVRESADKQS